MKKRNIGIVAAILLLVAGMLFSMNHIVEKKYTYDELNSMSATELYDLFTSHGLVIGERMQNTLTEEQIADMLKQEFTLLVEGGTMRSDLMYAEYVDQFQTVYESLTVSKE